MQSNRRLLLTDGGVQPGDGDGQGTGEDDRNRRWREVAYLTAKNWPEAIPAEGPKTRYGVYSWGKPDHDQYGIDNYPWSHPDAASIGHDYVGDICPMCGKPLKTTEHVVTKSGQRGELLEVSESEAPEPSYHPYCYDERREKLQQRQLSHLPMSEQKREQSRDEDAV